MQLDAVYQVCREARAEDVPHGRMVVTQTRESLSGVEIEIGPAGGVVEIRPMRRDEVLVVAEDSQDVDERRIKMAGGEVQRFIRTGLRIRYNAELVKRLGGLRVSDHGERADSTRPTRGWRPGEPGRDLAEPFVRTR